MPQTSEAVSAQMEQAGPLRQPFVCSICSNESASETALKRHVRYCRGRGVLGRSRQKACRACVRAKARCELFALGCFRCAAKGLACPLAVDQGLVDVDVDVDVDGRGNTQGNGIGSLNDASVVGSLGLGVTEGVSGDPLGLLALQGPLPRSNVVPGPKTGDLVWMSHQPAPGGSRLFEPRPFGSPSTLAASAMGAGILQSYPPMMRSRGTFPPFIHPFCYGSAADGWALPASLQGAMTVAGSSRPEDMLTGIRGEQRRISSELPSMSIEDLLASAQALAVYVIMRIGSGPSSDDDDVHLVALLSRACRRIPSLPGLAETLASMPPWRRWMIVESKRRLNSTLRLAVQLYNLDAAPSPCLDVRTAAPLPAGKLLWQAPSEEGWAAEVSRDAFYGALSLQDLMRFRGAKEGEVGQPSSGEWARWYAGADELGILVVISTSLLQ